MTISSYPSIYALGHSAIKEIFSSPVIIEEKIDGSQFSMMTDCNGELFCRSKGANLNMEAPEKMFQSAIDTAKVVQAELRPGWVYRCEYLQKPKHNTLAYDRVPDRHLIVFDVETGLSTFLDYSLKATEATRIGLETVPLIEQGLVSTLEDFNALLNHESVLGGCKIEGVVVKNYDVFTTSKHIAIGKYVSEAFKEKHCTSWKNRNPGQNNIIQKLIATYRVEARWRKAIQHLREQGVLTESPKDIGPLLKEVNVDVLKEETDTIKSDLFKHFWPQIGRGMTSGFAEWYKQELAKSAFE